MQVKKTEYTLLNAQYRFLFGFDKELLHQIDEEGRELIYNDVALYQGGVTCKKATAEWLSPTGWKTMDKLTKDSLMAVYYPEDKTIKFEHPKEVFIWDADEWYELDSRSIHQINCPNHRMYTIKDNKEYIQSMADFYEEHQNSKNGHRGKFVTTFKVTGSLHYSEDELRLAIAFQADGYDLKNNHTWQHAFHYKKNRKRERLEMLLKQANIEFYTRQEKDGYFRTVCNLPLTFKTFPSDWYKLDKASLAIIVDEVKYWDGTIEKTNESYYTSIKENADFIQFAYSACGYKSTITKRNRTKYILGQKVESSWTEYRVKSQNKNIMPSYYATRHKNIIKKYKAKKGEKKYCPSTSTKLWLCREFGRITVTGNSGKTFCGSLRGLWFALTFAGCRGLVGAKSQDLLDQTTKKTYLDHLDNIGLKEGVHWWFEDRKTTMKFCNGSVIRFKTLADWESFMSESFTWIEFEEASFIDEIVFLKLITRLRELKKFDWGDNYFRSIFLHTNPQGKRGWLNKLFINPKTKVPSYRYINASTRDNHFLGKEYVSMLEELYSEDQLREMVDGLDSDYDNTIAFPNFTQQNVKENIPFTKGHPIILTCDFNYNPMCWYIMQEINGVWYVLRELIENNVTTKEMCKRIQPVLDQYKTRKLIIMGDAHGRDRKTNGSDYGIMVPHFVSVGYDVTLTVQKFNPPVKERLATLRGMIRNAKGECKFFVDSSCIRLLYNFDEAKNNLQTGTIKAPTDKEIQDDPNKLYLIHPIDAISYPIHYMNSWRAAIGEEM